MAIFLEMPNGDRLEFPDGTADNVIQSAGDKYMRELPGQMALEGMSGFDKFAAGAGQRLANWGRGAGQYLGMVSKEDVDAAKTRDAALMSTTPAKIGDAVTTMAAGLPTLLVPGANTVTGGAIVGGLMGALEQTGTGDSALMNTAAGAGFGGAGQAVANRAARAIGDRFGRKVIEGFDARQLNAPKDAALQAGRELGYVINPAQSNAAGFGARQIQGLGGKYAIDQNVSLRNQSVTNQAVRSELGIPENVPVTEGAISKVISDAWKQGYEPVKMLGRINWSPTYKAEIESLSKGAPGSLLDNAGAESIEQLANKLNFTQISGREALSTLRDLRTKAQGLYKQHGRNQDQATLALAQAHQRGADALEALIEENAFHKGQAGIVPKLREARQRMAKAFDVDRALTDATGNVSARDLATALDRGAPLTGNLEKIARFASNFPDAVKPVETIGASANPTRADTLLSILSGLTGSAAFGPAGVAAAALPYASRQAALSTALSPMMQNMMARPSYGPGILSTLGFTTGRPLLKGAAPGASVYGAGLLPLPYTIQQ